MDGLAALDLINAVPLLVKFPWLMMKFGEIRYCQIDNMTYNIKNVQIKPPIFSVNFFRCGKGIALPTSKLFTEIPDSLQIVFRWSTSVLV